MGSHRLLITLTTGLTAGGALGVFLERFREKNGSSSSSSSSSSLGFDIPPAPAMPTIQALEKLIPSGTNVIPSDPMPGNRVAQIMRFGFPSMSNLRSYGNYILSYDQRTRCPNWVFEHLTPEGLKERNADRTSCSFEEDPSIHAYFRATDKDFKGSGFDRGHMAAAANNLQTWKNLQETFYYTNVAPQVGVGFNRGIWNKLEKYVRSLARRNKNVYVCTGPLYLPRKDEEDGKLYVKYQLIGKNHIAVPTHFFKVVLIESEVGEFELLSFMLPNEAHIEEVQLKLFLRDVEEIERAAGLLFFDKLPQNRIKMINKQEIKVRRWR